jgi:ABC-type nitrate/sulfonate/bicarbonate transport system ATPase subunit
LVVTHDLHTAFYLASRIAMLNERQNCRIRFTGSDKEIS